MFYHPFGEVNMRQGLLPFQLQDAADKRPVTAHAGLCAYLELACVVGLPASVLQHVKDCSEEQGWTDEQMVLSLVCLNLAGGECVEDLQILESDEGFGRVLGMAECEHLSRQQRRALGRRWHKGRSRHTPSPSAVFRFLAAFHDPAKEAQRQPGKAFIPTPTEGLKGLMRVNTDLVGFLAGRAPQKTATLDMDATLIETYKRDALQCYKGFKAYQPMNVYWAECEVLLHSYWAECEVLLHSYWAECEVLLHSYWAECEVLLHSYWAECEVLLHSEFRDG